MKKELYDDKLINEMQFLTATDGKGALNELTFEELDAIAAGGLGSFFKSIAKGVKKAVKKVVSTAKKVVNNSTVRKVADIGTAAIGTFVPIVGLGRGLYTKIYNDATGQNTGNEDLINFGTTFAPGADIYFTTFKYMYS